MALSEGQRRILWVEAILLSGVSLFIGGWSFYFDFKAIGGVFFTFAVPIILIGAAAFLTAKK